MSHEPAEGKPVTIHASKEGGGGWKWIAGAAAAAALAGGGYYAWTQMAPTPAANTDVASNAAYSSDISEASPHAAPLSSSPQSTAPQGAASRSGTSQSPQSAPQQGATPQSASQPTQGAPTQSAPTQSASNRAGATPAASGETRLAQASPTHRRTLASHSAPQPSEEVIGVTPASAIAQDDNPIVVEAARRPLWTQRPSAWRLASTYPTRALEEGREGEASIHCTVLQNGALDCVRVSEFPANAGFGGAALRVAQMYRHSAMLANGKEAIGAPVNLRVLFRIADNDRHSRG